MKYLREAVKCIFLRSHILFADFWRCHPALLYGWAVLMGAAMALNQDLSIALLIVGFLPLLPFFYGPEHSRQIYVRLLLAGALAVGSFCLTHSRYQFPESPLVKTPGWADIDITSVSTTKTPFGRRWLYKGTLLSFITKGEHPREIAKNIPFRLSMPYDALEKRPLANHRYRVSAQLKETSPRHFTLTAKSDAWQPLAYTGELVEWRYRAKTALQDYIYSTIGDRHVAAFLAGIATGEYDDLQLSVELGRFGLQHLMAISGLHFSILATILGVSLCACMSRRHAALVVVVLLSGYFLFLGNSPSIVRAWVAIAIGLIGLTLGKRSTALNSLGLGLLVVALWDPPLMHSIAFQFSFAVTAAILLWFPACDSWLQKIFAKRSLSQMAESTAIEQHAYCLLCFLRQALALSLAVNLVALPLTLYHFHKFPVMSVLYNLFFPFAISLSIILLLLALLMAPLSLWLSACLHYFNEHFTHYLLNMTFHLPKAFHITWHLSALSLDYLLFYLSVVLLGGIYLHAKQQQTELFAV